MPLAALTAWQALVDTARITAGQRVLVHAVAGGVGHLAAQIAKARGAFVVGTARADKHAALCALGVDQLVDHTAAAFEDVVADVDVVLDLVGGEYSLRSLPTLRPGGFLIAVPGGVAPELARAAAEQKQDLRVTGILVEPDYAGLERIGELVDGGQLRPRVDATFDLGEAAKAHELGEASRTFGKLVLTTGA